MKTRNLLLVLFLFVNCTIASAQSGWGNFPTGGDRDINDIHFVNSNTGWAVGDSGIFKSTNGGINWTRQNFNYNGKNVVLNSVKFLNENTGFAAGGHWSGAYYFNYQYIYKTTNGGVNWFYTYSAGSVGTVITKIIPLDENNIFLALAGTYFDASTGGIYKSTNAGSNFSLSVTKGESNALCFINSNTGWASGYYMNDVMLKRGHLLKTTNGGTNWVEQYKDSMINATNIYSIQFLNQNTGFAIGSLYNNKSRFFKTTNGGDNWDTVTYNHSRGNSLFFINQSTGWIGGNSYPDTSSIAYTTNGGANWILQKKNYQATVKNIFFINNQTGWAAFNSSNILKTTTSGLTFIQPINTEIPASFSLGQNYPNPFNPVTNIEFQVPSLSFPNVSIGGYPLGHPFVKLVVYDLLGREVKTLVNEYKQAGTYQVSFNAEGLSSGIYFYKMTAGDFSETKKLVLIK